MSLRARLLLGMLALAAVLVLSAIVITGSTRSHLIDQVDAQLRDASLQLRPRPGALPARPINADADADADGPTPALSHLYVGTISATNRLVTLHLPDLRDETAPLPVLTADDIARLRSGQAVTVSSDRPGSEYRLLTRAQNVRGGIGVVGLSLDDVRSAVRRLVAVEALAVLSILTVLGLVIWWVIRLGVRPVQRMTETAGAIAAGDLSQRVPDGTPGTEAGALSVALNGMLERIEEAFEQRAASENRLRQFVSDASHELRTPVTTIRGYAELYRTSALDDPAELGEAMRRTEQEAVRMGSLVEDLLHLARLDQHRPLSIEPVDLAALAADAVRDAGASAPGRSLVVDAPAPAWVHGDEHALRQVVANLVGNALVHAPDATVEVRARATPTGATLAVRDDGPGMSAPDAARAFERFYRADVSRSRDSGGSGLGLAVVEATVVAHGGSVSIDTEVGRGTTVHVGLPTRPPPADRDL